VVLALAAQLVTIANLADFKQTEALVAVGVMTASSGVHVLAVTLSLLISAVVLTVETLTFRVVGAQ
jgi:hypothetical protein